MKILLLLSAIAFLVFQTQSEATAIPKNEDQAQAEDQVEGEALDEVMAGDDAAEISSPNRQGLFGWVRPTYCQARGGVCRRSCYSTEYPAGRCFTEMYCCRRL